MDLSQLLAGEKWQQKEGTHEGGQKRNLGIRDPEMRHTRKGNQWHFGMKARIGVDSKSI